MYSYLKCMTVYLVISLPNIPYIHRTYVVLSNSEHMVYHTGGIGAETVTGGGKTVEQATEVMVQAQ
jgi:hypothetical protein